MSDTKKQKITLYQAIVEILNKKLDYKVDIITRQEIIKELRMKYDFFDRQPCWSNWERTVGCRLYSVSTLDTIRNMLEKVGFLDKVYKTNTNGSKIQYGWFYIKKQIPSDLTYNKLRKMYNNFQQKLKDYFTEHEKQPDEAIYFVLQTKNFLEFYEIS